MIVVLCRCISFTPLVDHTTAGTLFCVFACAETWCNIKSNFIKIVKNTARSCVIFKKSIASVTTKLCDWSFIVVEMCQSEQMLEMWTTTHPMIKPRCSRATNVRRVICYYAWEHCFCLQQIFSDFCLSSARVVYFYLPCAFYDKFFKAIKCRI